jgi:hypothetical protein
MNLHLNNLIRKASLFKCQLYKKVNLFTFQTKNNLLEKVHWMNLMIALVILTQIQLENLQNKRKAMLHNKRNR